MDKYLRDLEREAAHSDIARENYIHALARLGRETLLKIIIDERCQYVYDSYIKHYIGHWQEGLHFGNILLDNDAFPNSFRRESFKFVAGVESGDGSIYIFNINNYSYFSVTSDLIIPYTYEGAQDYTRQYWTDFLEWNPGELESMNERFGTNFDIDGAVSFVLETDGELHGFGDSGYEIQIEDEEYVFQDVGCGQIQYAALEYYALPEEIFRYINRVWNRYHLERRQIYIPNYKQDIDTALAQCTRYIIWDQE